MTDKDISVLVDLNEAANSTNPVIGNFQKVEKAMPYFSTASTAGYMSQAVAVDASGVIHRAWIQARGNAVIGTSISPASSATTPAYGVVYAKSFNGGKTFTDTVSVSGSLRFDLITPSLFMTSGFSTLDLVLDSKGNPRVVYAMDTSPDGISGNSTNLANQLAHKATAVASITNHAYNNIWFNYSNDGGSTWLPANSAVVINDTATVAGGNTNTGWPGRKCAFPRMAVTSTDDIFIVYERAMQSLTLNDVMLAKMDADSLKSGSAQQVRVGSLGTVGSAGGVRIDPDGNIGVTPDIAVGDDDLLHIVWFAPTGVGALSDPIVHKNLAAADWTNVNGSGWAQSVTGAQVGTFDTRTATNLGLDLGLFASNFVGSAVGKIHLFPTVVVDRARTPDRVYALWKHTDALAASPGADENIAYNTYTYNGSTGAGASWGTVQYAFPQGSGSAVYNTGGSGLFQQVSNYQIENFWGYVDRVSAWVDDAVPSSRGDLHIVFSGGPTQAAATLSADLTTVGKATSLYYARYNGTEWELPQVVASAKLNASDGVAAKYRQLFSPDIAMRSSDANVYLTFGDIQPLPFFKVIGRVSTYSDISVPTGANKYLLTYNPVNPQSAATKNLITVTVPDNANGSGIGGTTPGTSGAPGGFLTGQWRRIGLTSLGVSSLSIGTSGAVFKGATSTSEATNDNGVFEGKVDDDGSSGFPEWGDDADKVGLLVKLNILGSDSSDNLFVINASTATKLAGVTGVNNAANFSQSVSLAGRTITTSSFAKGVTLNALVDVTTVATAPVAPRGSYFWMGANISIVAANNVPVVQVTEPNAATIASGVFGNETAGIKYILFDSDTNVLTSSTELQMEMYAYPDKGLRNVQDIRTFGTLIVDEQDNTTVNSASGTNDFVEGTSSTNEQTYTWDDPGTALRALGFAAITKNPDGNYFIYLVADDLVNPPVFAVSAGALKVRHIPLVKSLAPVSNDTVDTGEFSILSKTNPYKINFQVKDYDDNAKMRLFFSTNASIPRDSVTVSGIFTDPTFTMNLGGARPIQLSDTLRSEEDVSFSFDVTAQGASKDSVLVQGNYTIYTVVSDGDTTVLSSSSKPLAVRHSPSFEFTSPLVGTVNKLNTTQQDRYTLEWQRGRSDRDLDGNAIISLYYIGIDPNRKNFSGTDSTGLVSDSGAVLIKGNIREDAEGKEDQFVWNFRNPPGALPKTFRPKYFTGTYRVDQYQVGRSTDTAWVYAVLHDTLGNTRVANGGAVLLFGSQQSVLTSPAPKVTMKTPPSGGQTIVNGDVVRLEWDAFLIDDGTGTDDAYLRLYAAPKGLYSTLTQLEANNRANSGQVILVNSLKGRDDVAGQIQTIRESDSKFFMWDTKTHSFGISGTPIEYDIFVAGSVDPQFGDNVFVNNRVDSLASGIGSQAQRAVLSKAPGALKVVGTDPIFSIELGPGAVAATSGDTLTLDVLVNSQGSSVNLMDLHLDVPRRYFEVIDLDTTTAGLQPFKDSTGAFQAASTIAQNDTTAGTAQFLKLNFVESVILGEAIGRTVTPFDSSQVAARLKLKVKRYTGGAPLDTVLDWSAESGRKTALYQNNQAMATSVRSGQVKIVPRARIIATVPLEGRSDYADTLDAHLRLIGSTADLTDTTYISSNDVKKVYVSNVLQDSVNVVSNSFGTFTLTEVPPGTYELAVKAKGYISGRSDTLRLFNGSTATIQPTFGSDALGALSPATVLNALRGGDATGDNQVDIADANLIFSRWNLTPASASFVQDADVNNDNVINSLDLILVTTNFGNDGYGAPPVFKRNAVAGDNSSALVELQGVDEVEKWWPGRTFEVKAKASGMQDVAGYGFTLNYDPEKVKPLAQAVSEGEIFKANPRGSLFYQQVQPGVVDVTAGRIGREWSASGDAELAAIRFVALADDPGQIEIVSGDLVNSDFRGVSMRVKKAQPLPMVAALHQNYPNPFNPSTEIRFDLPTARDVKLTIYNQLGQSIRTLVDRRMKAGAYALKWDGTDNAGQGAASGVYFYSIEAGDFSQILKMTLVK
ncbi:MAG: T9SS type A sorting domain-containing protein [Candidatus Latescibacteria bacterium]|nr:T9SS type A sorting domain-containing protein [Candidatus Latescibacterota bacterium]